MDEVNNREDIMNTPIFGLTAPDRTPASSLLKRVHVDPGNLRADRKQLAEIVDDLRECGGVYTPRMNWVMLDCTRTPDEVDDGRAYLEEGFSDEAVAARMSTMEQMMEAWIGQQRLPVSAGVVARYAPYVQAHDPLDLWTANVTTGDALAGLSIADLGSIVDLNIIQSHAPATPDRPMVVLEVGGGYGRLAEAALNVFGASVKYVLVDSVPGTLLYAREYMRRACPGARVGFYYDGDPFDLNAYDCYIVPSWHFESINNTDYDVCVNIESFQEMGQEQVDLYLGWFETVGRDGTLIYLSNAHDYRFDGEWNYPATWRRLMCAKAPRAWTSDHRTEVFIKSNDDHWSANAAIVAAYEWSLTEASQLRLLPSVSTMTKLMRRSPRANAQAVWRKARRRARLSNERRDQEAVFQRALAGDERAQEEFKSHWAR